MFSVVCLRALAVSASLPDVQILGGLKWLEAASQRSTAVRQSARDGGFLQCYTRSRLSASLEA
jgi:hypothetical protein